MRNLVPMHFILFTPEIGDFIGDLLQSSRQTSSFSVHEQNPTIPRPGKIMDLGL
jgi:hypothetical protein